MNFWVRNSAHITIRCRQQNLCFVDYMFICVFHCSLSLCLILSFSVDLIHIQYIFCIILYQCGAIRNKLWVFARFLLFHFNCLNKPLHCGRSGGRWLITYAVFLDVSQIQIFFRFLTSWSSIAMMEIDNRMIHWRNYHAEYDSIEQCLGKFQWTLTSSCKIYENLSWFEWSKIENLNIKQIQFAENII